MRGRWWCLWFLLGILTACQGRQASELEALESSGSQAWQEGLARAAAEHRPLLIYWGAPWCYRCYEVKRDVLADPEVVPVVGRFVQVHLNWDDDRLKALAKKWQIDGIPTMQVLSSQGEELGRLAGPELGKDQALALARFLN